MVTNCFYLNSAKEIKPSGRHISRKIKKVVKPTSVPPAVKPQIKQYEPSYSSSQRSSLDANFSSAVKPLENSGNKPGRWLCDTTHKYTVNAFVIMQNCNFRPWQIFQLLLSFMIVILTLDEIGPLSTIAHWLLTCIVSVTRQFKCGIVLSFLSSLFSVGEHDNHTGRIEWSPKKITDSIKSSQAHCCVHRQKWKTLTVHSFFAYAIQWVGYCQWRIVQWKW